MNQNVLTVEYGDLLKDKAESFLLDIFSDHIKCRETQPVAIEAAMNIIAGHSYYQPFNPPD